MGLGVSALGQEVEFEKLHNDSDVLQQPEKRNVTNKNFTITFIVALVALMPFFIYTLCNSDLRRIAGHDSCGNLCGEKNTKYDGIECSGQDMTSKPYLKDSSCVTECGPGYSEMFDKCYLNRDDSNSTPKDVDWALILYQIDALKWKIVLSALLTFVISGLLLIVFRYAVGVFVWGCIGLLVFALVAATAGFWIGVLMSSSNQGANGGFMVLAIFFTIVSLIVIVVLICLRNKIKLVIMLFTETAKFIFDLPHILLVPMISTIATLFIAIVSVVVCITFLTAGTFQPVANADLYNINNGQFEFRISNFTRFTLIYFGFMVIWIREIIEGAKFMTVAGTVCKWFFTRNKNELHSPILLSAKIVFKFHMGTLIFGGLILTIMRCIRALVAKLRRNRFLHLILKCLLRYIEPIIKVLTRNAYIITALHGTPFIESGKRAARLILENVVNFAALNFVGDFVLAMAKLLITVLSVLVSLLIMQSDDGFALVGIWVCVLVGILAFIIANSIFTTFENVTDAMFICFCEDMKMNDGIQNPYFMSTGLMQFMECSKKIIGEKKREVM